MRRGVGRAGNRGEAAEAHAHSDPDTHAKPDTNPDAGANTEPNAHAKPDTNPDAGTDTEPNAHAKPYPDSRYRAARAELESRQWRSAGPELLSLHVG